MRLELVEVGGPDPDRALAPAVDLSRDGAPEDLVELSERKKVKGSQKGVRSRSKSRGRTMV